MAPAKGEIRTEPAAPVETATRGQATAEAVAGAVPARAARTELAQGVGLVEVVVTGTTATTVEAETTVELARGMARAVTATATAMAMAVRVDLEAAMGDDVTSSIGLPS